jgi:hypothetical protein
MSANSTGSKPEKSSGLPIRWTLLFQVLAGAIVGLICFGILHAGVRMPGQLWLLSVAGHGESGGPGIRFPVGVAGPLLLTSAVFAALACPERLRGFGLSAVILIGFSLAFGELWRSGASTNELVSALLPISDARDYVFEADRIIDSHNLSPWGSRRPLASAFLASIFWIAGNNLRLAVTLLGLVSAASISFLLLQIRRQFGALGGAVSFLVLFFFYRRFLGSTLSETCGLACGALGLALLLDAFDRQKTFIMGLGLICLSTGLNARPGASLILPCLLLATIWRWRSNVGRAIRIAAGAACCIVFTSAANLGVFKAVGSEQGMLFSNLVYSVYGTIHGGDWTLAYKEHPEIFILPEGYSSHPERFVVPERKQSLEVLKIVEADVRNHPSVIWKGAIRAWAAFLMNRGGPFVYIPNWIVEKLMMFLGAAGLAAAVMQARSRSYSSVLVCGAAGIALSLPFAPPWDSDSMRAYAATIPFFAAFCACGTSAIYLAIRRPPRAYLSSSQVEQPFRGAPSRFAVPAAFALMFLIYLLPFYIRFLTTNRAPMVLRRMDESADLTFTPRPGNMVRIISGTTAPTFLPNVRRDEFLARLGEYASTYRGEAAYLRQLALHDPVLICPEDANLAFVVARASEALPGRPIRIQGRVYTLDDYCAFFVEDGLPGPVDGAR